MIRVLIIDDSKTMQAILSSRLQAEDDIEVVGAASNAAEGRDLIKQLDPDVVTLDIEMPGMNGLDFLAKIMTLRPTPVIIVSGSSQEGSAVAARALALGAVDCYAKSDNPGLPSLSDDGQLAAMIRQAGQVDFKKAAPAAKQLNPNANKAMPSANVGLIAIGASTGGVEALQTILADFPADCPPTIIVQHINARFAPAIATALDDQCAPKVQLAAMHMQIERGNIYIAPGSDKHLTVSANNRLRLQLKAGAPVSGHLPSVDVMLKSVAHSYGNDAVGILLTGMGQDGAAGLLEMSKAGAVTAAQDEATSTVFGMPRAAIECGAASHILPMNKIASFAVQKAELRRAG